MNDTDKLHYVHTGLYSAKAKEIMDSVFGQLSDGWGENNPRNERYWKFARVMTDTNGECLIEVEKTGSTVGYNGRYIENGFHHFNTGFFQLATDDEIKQWMARLVKKTAQMELRDEDGKSGKWDRSNANACVYLGHYDEKYGSVVTFADAYLVYEHLLGRNYASKYAFGVLEAVLGNPLTDEMVAANEAKAKAEAEAEAKIAELRKEAKEKIEAYTKQINAYVEANIKMIRDSLVA